MGNIKSVLFVCTGNSCRSVMAEGLLKKRLKEIGKDKISVASAGVRAVDGFSPTDETVEVLKREGVDASFFTAKNITDDMIERADLILAMENMHKREIVRRVPGASSKTYLLKEFGLGEAAAYAEADLEIPDPMGMPVEYYMKSMSEIKREIERIAKLL